MRRSGFSSGLVYVMLGLPALLWLLAALFRLRVVNIFHAYLMKFPGPWITLGAMAICPLVAMALGVRMVRRKEAPVRGWILTGAGGLLFTAFVAFIGVPMVVRAMDPGTPKNPGAPRPVPPQTSIPVFPGAEGFGTRTPAGRGGKVIEVTTLADAGPGSLRAALADPSRRIIVFRVSGTIELTESLFISDPFVTVAGQTAPGGGICLKNAGLVITTHDVLIQHLRMRPGSGGRLDADTNDAIQILGRHGDVSGAANVVIDHVSASWSEDETISTWYGAHDVTISWSIISEALDRSRHRKERHSAGLLIGDGSYNVTVHHSLLAHNDFRNPLISDGGTHDIVNNVIYNWGRIPAEVFDRDSNSFLNFVGNYFLPGPSTESGPYEITVNPAGGTPKLYVAGNLGPHRLEATADDGSLVSHGWGSEGPAPARYRARERFAAPPVTTLAATEALERVLARAGATLPVRDSVDRRIVADVRHRTGSIIDSPRQVGGYPELAGGTAPPDADHDGMPDAWEARHGLDPRDAGDGPRDSDGNGYTHIEEYLHSLLPDRRGASLAGRGS